MKFIQSTIVCGAALIAISPASADHKVYSPVVEEGVLELEARGQRTVDSAADKNDQQNQVYEISYGVNSWWYTAVFGNLTKDPQGGLQYNATALENIFQLTPQGEYWMDVGLYLEYAKASARNDPDELEFKLLLEKQIAPFVVTANLIFNRDIGPNAGKGAGFEYALRANYPWKRAVQFGVEAFGEPGRLTGLDPVNEQHHLIGPVISGKFNLPILPGNFVYNVGYLFGMTQGSPAGEAKWELEYEIPF
ncbi:MAG: hypothetical protein JWM91_1614 [Rhodospirillales bacterium]|nr:hypothetical protein [Rhodospirillales bacterium]